MATTKRGGPKGSTSKRGRSGSKKREGDRSSKAAPAGAVKPIAPEEVAKVSPRPLDLGSLPGFTVTVTGSLPKVLASIVLRKGPIPASSKEAAIATLMAEVGTQFKKSDLFAVESCFVEEAGPPKAPTLPFDGTAKKTNGSVEQLIKTPAPASATPAAATAGTAATGPKTLTAPEPAKRI
jgi:hypothetical protein